MVNAYDEILDFVTSGPSLQAIVDFRHSEATLERVSYLMMRQITDAITDREREELREFQKADYFIDQLKIRALRRLGLPA